MDRDLDALIAKDIFKWRYIPVSSDVDGENKCEILFPPDREPTQDFYSALPRRGKIHEGWYAPNYTESLLNAIKLAKHVGLPLTVAEMPTDAAVLARLSYDHFMSTPKQ